MLEKEFDYYLAHQDDLVKKYNGKVLVIADERVIGVYNSDAEALDESIKHHKLGTFLIQKCSPGNSDYTQKFHSCIAFNQA